jgi:hypothetical protein
MFEYYVHYIMVSQVNIKKAACKDANRIPFFQGRSVRKFVTVFYIMQGAKMRHFSNKSILSMTKYL